jgi:hypothetical protein
VIVRSSKVRINAMLEFREGRAPCYLFTTLPFNRTDMPLAEVKYAAGGSA